MFRDGARMTEGSVKIISLKLHFLMNVFMQVSFTFGADVVSKFLNRHDLDLICRAHQVCIDKTPLLGKLDKWEIEITGKLDR